MDGICRVAGAGLDWTYQGRRYWIRALTLGDLALAEYRLLVERTTLLDDIQAAVKQFPALVNAQTELQERALAEMRSDRTCRVITAQELFHWLLGPHGTAFFAFRCLERRPQGPPWFATLEQAHAWLAELPTQDRHDLEKRLHMAAGLDLLSSLEWPEKDDSKHGKFVPWKRIYRSFAETYYWTPEQVNRLTLFQLRLYTASEDELGGTMRMNPKQLAEYQLKRKERSQGNTVKGPTRHDSPARRKAREMLTSGQRRHL